MNTVEKKWGMKPNVRLAIQLAKRDVPALVYDAVNLEGVAMTLPEVPAKRQQEFNTLMLDFYSSNKMEKMNLFLRSCLNEKIIRKFQMDLDV